MPILLVDNSVIQSGLNAGALEHILNSGYDIEVTETVVAEALNNSDLTPSQRRLLQQFLDDPRVTEVASPDFPPGSNNGERSLRARLDELIAPKSDEQVRELARSREVFLSRRVGLSNNPTFTKKVRGGRGPNAN